MEDGTGLAGGATMPAEETVEEEESAEGGAD